MPWKPAVIELGISIHAPVKGATNNTGVPGVSVFNFNPRTREGCDANNQHSYPIAFSISIHAPVKGATSAICDFDPTKDKFQSTHP